MLAQDYDLNRIAAYFSSFSEEHQMITHYSYMAMQPYLQGNSCLEIGCCDGRTIFQVINHFKRIVGVDGSEVQIERLRDRILQAGLTHIEVCLSYIENFQTDEKFDTIIANFIMEHVENPRYILNHIKKFLAPNGILLLVVPNGYSIHRKLGLAMNLISSLTDLSPRDIKDGHRRTYIPETFIADIESAGFHVRVLEGILLKPFTFEQIKQFNLSRKLLDACFEVGKEFPRNCMAMLAVVNNV